MESRLMKRQKLRNNEYYDMQEVFDELYADSTNNLRFRKLMKHISSDNNIKLAYRNIKGNKGSVTPGIDNLNMKFIEKMGIDNYIQHIKKKLNNYSPKSVRRVEIPKPNGKTRPLGIPCIDDRIIQQCIKQILEPICEAKFHNHSYAFRPNRSTKHAIARANFVMWKMKLHYVVDVDIQGFFDNVNHNKLMHQLWFMGIQDKNLLKILGKILKSEIQGIGMPTKGTSQGGIISPLLSNIVLNEFDWWISSQWESYSSHNIYANVGNMHRVLKNSNLKEMWIVRYADDFKIFCRDWRTAQKIFIASNNGLRKG
ncbi:reverse transcriptase domain-containing protein [Oceanirhabdus sp. W0125-5]|uniref:reverse transcriptase domain-containing protein n=1 Tax=Oceanirhabdus sp. W0125-5 TaxID=2999116 RepID=UPI002FDE8259